MLGNSSSNQKIYHAHVYFNAATLKKALSLQQEINNLFNIEMGRVHKKLVGPHPEWSYQIKFGKGQFSELLPWLINNRQGLTIFIHECTGNNLLDHTENICWLGCSQSLNLEGFKIQS